MRRRPFCPSWATLLLVCAALVPSGAFGSPAGSEGEGLVGVWVGRRDFGPEVAGPLTLRHDSDGWTAEISGYRLPVTSDEGLLGFEVPGDRGAFHGRPEAGSASLRGQWIQPGAVSMFGQRFSTPVRLEPAGAGLWRGDVHPLADRVHLYFVLQPAAGGGVRAFLRNPEVNFGRFFDLTRVEQQGETVRFWGRRAGSPDAETQVYFEGRYHQDPERLSVVVDSLGGTYDLTRLGPGEPSGFEPRDWQSEPYRYRPPTPMDDGWRTGTLESVGLSASPIEALVQKILTTPIVAIDSPAIDAVLIARHGVLVLEEYFHGWGPRTPHDTRSASKSITSTLVGTAVHQGLLRLDSRLYEVMAEDAAAGGGDLRDLDPHARDITVEDLLTMSSGLACDDWDPDSPGGEDRMQQGEQPDWYRYTLGLPMIHAPGEHTAYCSAGMNLAGGMVARAGQQPLTELFDRYLARPLQLGTYHTNLMPTGEAYAGGGLRLTGRDFLKFGQLLLDDGSWRGRRLLDPGWSAAATARRTEMGRTRTESYGYGWWLFDYQLGGRTFAAIYAGGNGGNYIIVVPELDLAIVFLASNYNQAVMHRTKYEDVPEYILTAAVDGG